MNNMHYLSSVTGTVMTDPEIYQNTIDYYKDGKFDLEKEVLFGLKNQSQLETTDALRMQLHFSKNANVVKALMKYYAKPKENRSSIFTYVTPILNEYSGDEEVKDLCTKISSNYAETIKGIEDAEYTKELIRDINAVFTPGLDTDEEEIQTPKDIRDYIDMMEEEFYDEIAKEFDGLRIKFNGLEMEAEYEGDLNEAVSPKDIMAKVSSKTGKFLQFVEDKVNRIRKIWQERNKKEYYDRYMNDNWRLKRFLVRLLVMVPGFFVAPIVTTLVFFYQKIFDWRNDRKYRRRAAADLEIEIKIIDEKMHYTDQDGNREAKIKLMRERDRLQRILDDIKANRVS